MNFATKSLGWIVLCLGASLMGACTSTHSSSLSQSSLPPCPGAGGDLGASSPTTIERLTSDHPGRLLAHTTTKTAVVVKAVVASTYPGEKPRSIPSLVRSQLLIATEEQPSAGSVIARSTALSTTDLHRHILTVRVPAGLTARDYFVLGKQQFTQRCEPKSTGETIQIIGRVRVSR